MKTISPYTLLAAAISVGLFYLFRGGLAPFAVALVFALGSLVAMGLRMPEYTSGQPYNRHLENAIATTHLALIMVVFCILCLFQFPLALVPEVFGHFIPLTLVVCAMAVYTTIRSRYWQPY